MGAFSENLSGVSLPFIINTPCFPIYFPVATWKRIFAPLLACENTNGLTNSINQGIPLLLLNGVLDGWGSALRISIPSFANFLDNSFVQRDNANLEDA